MKPDGERLPPPPFEEDDDDPIGLDTYGYPQITHIGSDYVTIAFGWFFAEDGEDEPASYVEIVIDKDGKAVYRIDVQWGFLFDFKTKLRDYGFWIDHGFGKYFAYADHHIQKRDKLKHFVKNIPWKLKRWAYWHVPLARRISDWRYQRYCRSLFK